MNEDLRFDPGPVITCSNALQRIQGEAAGIMELAVDANPDWYTWGLLGLVFSDAYWGLADELYKHLGMMGQALRDRIDSLDQCVANYEATEHAITDAFNKIKQLTD